MSVSLHNFSTSVLEGYAKTVKNGELLEQIKKILKVRKELEEIEKEENNKKYVEPKLKCPACEKIMFPIYALSAPAIVHCSECGVKIGYDNKITDWIREY